jgi:hypothetical protein
MEYPVSEFFWGPLLLVVAVGAVMLVRLVAKQPTRSSGEQTRTGAGLGRATHTSPSPPRPGDAR